MYYAIFSSTNLAAWNPLGTATNTLGVAVFTDAEATNSPQQFYYAQPVYLGGGH